MRGGIPLAALALLWAAAGCSTGGSHAERRSGQSPAEINVQLGIGYLQQGKLELAHAKLSKALEQDPRLPSAHNVIAILYERLGQPERAEEHYRRALALDPADAGAHNNYGQFLCTRHRLAEAQTHFREALQNPLYQTPAVAHTNAGICALQIPDRAKAEEHLRKALEIDPRYPAALIEMARLNYEQEHPVQARAYLQRYHEVASADAESLWLGIRTERKLGNREAAMRYALQLKERFPDSEETKWLLESE